MKYVADDGTEFTNEKDCLAYEGRQNNSLIEIAETWVNDIHIYDKTGARVPLMIVRDEPIDRFFERLDDILEDVCKSSYIEIPPMNNEIRAAIGYMTGEEYYLNVPEASGFWFYDDNNDTWLDYDESKRRFNEVWGRVGKGI